MNKTIIISFSIFSILFGCAACSQSPLVNNSQKPESANTDISSDDKPHINSVPASSIYDEKIKLRWRVYIPIDNSITGKTIWRTQGTSGYWGTCGEVCIANTVNIATGSTYSESDIVSLCRDAGLMDETTGGMNVRQMVSTYKKILPEGMSSFGYGGTYALDTTDIGKKLKQGMLLNVSIYGEMMREGGHTGEGDVYSDHWIIITGAVEDSSGNTIGYNIIDSASAITYLSCSDFDKIYHGYEGTNILDSTCIAIYAYKIVEGQ